jgi:hypothetical protein
MRIAAQVVEHRELRLEVRTLDRGRQCIIGVAEDRLVYLPLDRHQLAVRAEEHVRDRSHRLGRAPVGNARDFSSGNSCGPWRGLRPPTNPNLSIKPL